MSVKAIPDEYHSVTSYLTCENCSDAIDFYVKAFNASESFRMEAAPGLIGHAEVVIGNSPVMLADPIEEAGNQSPNAYGGSPVSLMVYCEEVDSLFAQAIAAGATELQAVQDQFYGDRSGTLKDPFGHTWTLATHKEDLTPDEIAKRLQDMAAEEK